MRTGFTGSLYLRQQKRVCLCARTQSVYTGPTREHPFLPPAPGSPLGRSGRQSSNTACWNLRARRRGTGCCAKRDLGGVAHFRGTLPKTTGAFLRASRCDDAHHRQRHERDKAAKDRHKDLLNARTGERDGSRHQRNARPPTLTDAYANNTCAQLGFGWRCRPVSVVRTLWTSPCSWWLRKLCKGHE